MDINEKPKKCSPRKMINKTALVITKSGPSQCDHKNDANSMLILIIKVIKATPDACYFPKEKVVPIIGRASQGE